MKKTIIKCDSLEMLRGFAAAHHFTVNDAVSYETKSEGGGFTLQIVEHNVDGDTNTYELNTLGLELLPATPPKRFYSVQVFMCATPMVEATSEKEAAETARHLVQFAIDACEPNFPGFDGLGIQEVTGIQEEDV